MSIRLVLQDRLLNQKLYQDSCLFGTTLGGGRRLYWCVVLASIRYNVTTFCMKGFSVSALSVPTKLSIRHRDRISLKGWVSVLWYFVDDLLLLLIDARSWKRLVRRGCWWFLIRAPYSTVFRETVDKLIRRHSQSLHLTINMTLTENIKFDEVWKRSAMVRAITREMSRSHRCFIPLWFTAGLISCFSDTVMAAKVVNNRCSSDKNW